MGGGFLLVAVAHQVEHRIVTPEVAGSRPVSHPNTETILTLHGQSKKGDAGVSGWHRSSSRFRGRDGGLEL